MDASLRDNVALIIDDNRAVGDRIADRLRRAGATVLVASPIAGTDRTSDGDHIDVDLRELASIDDAIGAAVSRTGRINTLICNVNTCTLEEPTTEEWNELWHRALTVPWYASALVRQTMQQQANSAIVFVAAGEERGYASLAKAALAALARKRSAELSSGGIRANCITSEPFSGDAQLEERQRVHEIAALVHFLAAPTGRYTTGQTIQVASVVPRTGIGHAIA